MTILKHQNQHLRINFVVGIGHYIKYARIRVFNDPHSPIQGQNRGFCFLLLLFIYLFIYTLFYIDIYNKSIKHGYLYNSLYTSSYTNGIQ